MKTTTNTYRNLILDISEMDENSNAWSIALKMMLALKNDEISNWQFDQLSQELKYVSERYELNTVCKELKVSIF